MHLRLRFHRWCPEHLFPPGLKPHFRGTLTYGLKPVPFKAMVEGTFALDVWAEARTLQGEG